MAAKLRNIPIAEVKVPPVRITAVYDEELQRLLKDSLEVLGQVQPIIVIHEDETYWLVDGLHRLEEAGRSGKTTIPAVVYPGDYKDVLLKNLVLNRIHGKTKASEMVEVMGYLYKELGFDTIKVAEETGLSRDYVEKLIIISQAAPSVRDALDKEVIGVGHAYEISRIPGHTAQEEIMAKQQLWRWSIKDLRQQIDNVLQQIEELKQAPVPKRQPMDAIYSCDGCLQELDPRHLRSIMVCPDCYGELWRLKRPHSPLPTTTHADVDEAPPA